MERVADKLLWSNAEVVKLDTHETAASLRSEAAPMLPRVVFQCVHVFTHDMILSLCDSDHHEHIMRSWSDVCVR
jgi:hypothetical protein